MESQGKRKRIVEIKQYTLKELANIYCTTRYLMLRQIRIHEREIGRRIGYYYDAAQVERIFQLIRLPSSIEVL